jgi:pSer/pThr/pTyr-binding forkhead associated (FHA) protein
MQYTCLIKDLKSTNGTFVNNCRIESGKSYSLKDGDYLRFGCDELQYKICFNENVKSKASSFIHCK